MTKKVSDIISDFLEEKGIRCVFGIIGSGNAHIFDSIYHKGYTEIVCVHHEQAALMAAGTYFRTTGQLSAALLTTGAGSLNGITGAVSLWMDSIPCLILSGNENSKFTIPENELRIWGIQGYDSTKVVEDYCKYTKRIFEPNQIRNELGVAYDIARSGRPGPVWLDIPMNIQAAPVELSQMIAPKSQLEPRFHATRSVATIEAGVAKVAADLTKAERPVLWLGHGIRLAGAVDLIEPLLKQLNIPALVSWAGIDMIASDHPSVFGRAGIYGQRASNFVLQNCDYLLTIGTRLAIPQVGYDLSELAREAKIAVVDIDPLEAEKYPARVETCIAADAKDFIEGLLDATRTTDAQALYGPWWEQCRHYRKKFPWIGPEHADAGGFINSYRFIDRLSSLLSEETIIVTDMGTALLSGHQALRLKQGQRLMTSTGLGEMGFGLPAAIGASFARERGEVVCLNCDGGMMMNLQELQTIAHHKLPIKIIIFNNDGYLMIKHTQKALFKGRYSGTDKISGVSCPDYSRLADVFGFPAFQVRTWSDFEDVIPKFLNETAGAAICEIFMHPEQLFVPKLGLAPQKDGSIVSPPLEDLSPFLKRDALRKEMISGLHPKSEKIES